jgi:hypothetical protein
MLKMTEKCRALIFVRNQKKVITCIKTMEKPILNGENGKNRLSIAPLH